MRLSYRSWRERCNLKSEFKPTERVLGLRTRPAAVRLGISRFRIVVSHNVAFRGFEDTKWGCKVYANICTPNLLNLIMERWPRRRLRLLLWRVCLERRHIIFLRRNIESHERTTFPSSTFFMSKMLKNEQTDCWTFIQGPNQPCKKMEARSIFLVNEF
jgi:hypothetical protein